MALVILVSLFFLINNSIRLDESQSLWQTSRSLTKIFEVIAEDVHIPLYHTLLHLWQSYLGSGVAGARLLSLILFVVSIPIIYILTQSAYKRHSVSMFATLLVAISPFLNWYANEVRMYTLLILLVVSNQYFFLRIYRKNDKFAYIGFAITSLLGIYTHYFFSAYLLINAVFFLATKSKFKKGTFKKFIFIVIGIGLAFLPWVLFVISRGAASNTKPLLLTPTTVDLFNTFTQFMVGFQPDTINTLIISLWPLLVILLFLLLKRQTRAHQFETLYFITIAFAPLITIFMFSLVVRPFFVSRYLAFAIPSLYILLSHLITLYGKRLQNIFKVLLVVFMILGFTTQLESRQSPVSENYKEAVEYINSNISYQDVFIVSAPFTIYPVEYYYNGDTPIQTLPIWDRTQFGQIPPFDENTLPDEVEALTANKAEAWVLLSYDQGYQEEIRMYFDKNFEKIDGKEFSKGLTLNVYRLRY
jgi:mannosyltransferase